MQRRLDILEYTEWDPKVKSELKKLLQKPEVHSSEHSDEDEEGRRVFNIQHLPWERKRITSVKKLLDEVYMVSVQNLLTLI